MWEFLNPSTLQMVAINMLHAAQSNDHSCRNNSGPRQGKPLLEQPQEPQLSVGKN